MMINLETLKRIQWLQIFATISGSLVKFTTGLMIGWASPSLPKLIFDEKTNGFLTEEQGFLVANALNIGQCVAIPIVALTVDLIGRKNGILCCVPPIILSWILIGFSQSFELLFFARFIGGIGSGYGKTVICMYTSEIAQPEIRGSLGTVTTLMTRLGMLMIFSVGPFVSVRLMAVISSTFTFLMFVTFVWMPKSPYYLLLRGKIEAAKESLMLFRGKMNANSEFIKIQENIATQKPFIVVFKKLIFIPSNRKALVITFSLMLFEQFSGMSAVIMYSQSIFEKTGTKILPAVCSIITISCQTLSLAICVIIVDRFGRRPMLLVSLFGTSLSLIFISVYFYLENVLYLKLSPAISWIPLIALLFYHFSFMMGIGTLPFIMQNEVFPTDVKAIAISLSSLILPLLTVLVTKIFQVLISSYNPGVIFSVFSIVSFFGIIFVTLFVPETRGLPLEDIQKLFDHKKSNKIEKKHVIENEYTVHC